MGGDGEFMFDRVHAIKTENGRSRGDDGDSQMAKRGGLSWLGGACVLEQWADASGAPRPLSQKAAVVSPL